MKTAQAIASSGKVTLCLKCDGSGIVYRGDSCWECGGFGILFEGKDFSTSLTTTRVVPDKAGENLIRPTDDLHDNALVNYHRKVLENKIQLIYEYDRAKEKFRNAQQSLKDANIVLPEGE